MDEYEYETIPLVGNDRCSVKKDNGICGNMGVYHMLVDSRPEGAIVAILCFDCFEEVLQIADKTPLAHPIGSNCGMPGTYWSIFGCFVI